MALSPNSLFYIIIIIYRFPVASALLVGYYHHSRPRVLCRTGVIVNVPPSLILPSDSLGHKKFIQTHIGVESAPAAVLDTTMREDRLIMNCHAVNVYGTVE